MEQKTQEKAGAPSGFTVDFARKPWRYMVGDRGFYGVTDVLRDNGFIDDRFYDDVSRSRGSAVHLACLYFDRGTLNWNTLHQDLHGYVRSWEKLKLRVGLRIVEAEVARYHESFGLAGTLDRLVEFGGWEHVWDLKSGAAPSWARYQTAAYELLLPKYHRGLRKRAAIELHKDGRMASIKDHDDSADGNYFLSYLTSTQRRQFHGIVGR